MKRISFLFLVLGVFALGVNAQLVVDSVGRVLVGEGNASSQLSVYAKESKQAKAAGVVHLRRGVVGIDVTAKSSMAVSPAIGLLGRSVGAKCNIGVMGSATYLFKGRSSVGIYGTTSFVFPENLDYPGTYAGYFDGPVLATGKIYGSVYSLASVPKLSSAKSVQTPLLSSEEGESICDKLLSLQPVQFVCEEKVARSVPCQLGTTSECVENLNNQAFSSNVAKEEKTKLVKHYGIDGEQLKNEFPELVDEDLHGNFHINYSEMVPLLLQSIRELSSRVRELEGNNTVVKRNSQAMSIENYAERMDVVKMSQNAPNPFAECSTIKLNVPESTKSAIINIYDQSGKLVKTINLVDRGETDITVYASDLAEGMFLYSLVIDGAVVATRRMVVTRK